MTKQTYQIVAFNYAHDSENKIHDDASAARYGFKGGLVPGVADYAYLARAAFKVWGEPWLRGGSMQAKFIKPVYHGEVATAIAEDDGDADQVSLTLLNPAGEPCAIGSAKLHNGGEAPDITDYPHRAPIAPSTKPPPTLESFSPGLILGSVDYVHDTQSANELTRSLFVEALQPDSGEPLWHPALCLSYANRIVKENVQLDAWVHTASRVEYFDQPVQGESVSLRGSVANTWEKRGHVVTELDLAMFADAQRALARIHHTAIIHLAGS